jgi:hypothetical protein
VLGQPLLDGLGQLRRPSDAEGQIAWSEVRGRPGGRQKDDREYDGPRTIAIGTRALRGRPVVAPARSRVTGASDVADIVVSPRSDSMGTTFARRRRRRIGKIA